MPTSHVKILMSLFANTGTGGASCAIDFLDNFAKDSADKLCLQYDAQTAGKDVKFSAIFGAAIFGRGGANGVAPAASGMAIAPAVLNGIDLPAPGAALTPVPDIPNGYRRARLGRWAVGSAIPAPTGKTSAGGSVLPIKAICAADATAALGGLVTFKPR